MIIGLFAFTKFQKRTDQKVALAPKKEFTIDMDAQKIFDTLTQFENRITQQELKKSTGFSDAKLSLILSELEAHGKIQKFKRGRGNIIRKL